MEVYTYVKMGGSADKLLLKPLGGAEVLDALARFDASKARCFLDGDRQKLLAVIETGFGDLAPFNKVARGLLGAGEAKEEGSSWGKVRSATALMGIGRSMSKGVGKGGKQERVKV